MKNSIQANPGTKKSYSDLLKDPRWQRKRLEILNRDNFQCRACEENEKTLHVHHTYYDKKLQPWEYENQYLVTLCERCHDVWHYIDNYKIGCWDVFSAVVDCFMEKGRE